MVDLSVASDDRATLVITHAVVIAGPDTANRFRMTSGMRAAHAFASKLPNQKLPFGVVPKHRGRADRTSSSKALPGVARRVQTVMTTMIVASGAPGALATIASGC